MPMVFDSGGDAAGAAWECGAAAVTAPVMALRKKCLRFISWRFISWRFIFWKVALSNHIHHGLSYSSGLSTCAYCSLAPDDAWLITEHVAVVPHPNPLTPCHVVVAPRRHVAAFYDLDVQEQRMIWDAVGEIQKRIASALKVEGFDV